MTMTAPARIELTPQYLQAVIDGNTPTADGPRRRPHGTRRNLTRILWELIERGPVTDKSGTCTALLVQRLDKRGGLLAAGPNKAKAVGMSGFSGTLKELDHAGLITRQINGKRCHRIAAVVTAEELTAAGYDRDYTGWPAKKKVEPEPTSPELPPLLVVAHPNGNGHSNGNGHHGVETEPELPDFHVDDRNLRPMGMLVEACRLIATALAEIPTLATPDPAVAHRLADTLEENRRLRHRADRAEQQVQAQRTEVEGMRRMKHLLELNMEKMAKGTFDAEAYRRFKELDQQMRAAPTSAKAD